MVVLDYPAGHGKRAIAPDLPYLSKAGDLPQSEFLTLLRRVERLSTEAKWEKPVQTILDTAWRRTNFPDGSILLRAAVQISEYRGLRESYTCKGTMGSSAKAFVSYSRTDSDFVLRLCRDLRAAGASIWLDRLDILPGEEWDQEIERGLAECGRMLVVLSPESVASPNVLDEIGSALSKKKAIIPILYRDCEIPYRLNRIQYVDFRTGYDAGLRDLLSSLSGAKEEDSGTISIPVPEEGRRRRWYWLAGAVVIASLLAWTGFGRRAVPPEPRPAPARQEQQPVAAEPPARPTTNPAAKNPTPASKPSFRDLFRTTLTRYIAEAPSGFQKLGAKEFVKWTPSVSFPEAVSCSGSGYPRDPVIECVLYRTDSEVEAANRFEDLIDLTQATMPEWEGHRLNLFNASFSSSKTSALVGLGATKIGDHYDVVIAVRRGSK